MVIVKLIIRILLLPVRISLTIVQLVVMFITWLSATVFNILSGIICIMVLCQDLVQVKMRNFYPF